MKLQVQLASEVLTIDATIFQINWVILSLCQVGPGTQQQASPSNPTPTRWTQRRSCFCPWHRQLRCQLGHALAQLLV